MPENFACNAWMVNFLGNDRVISSAFSFKSSFHFSYAGFLNFPVLAASPTCSKLLALSPEPGWLALIAACSLNFWRFQEVLRWSSNIAP